MCKRFFFGEIIFKIIISEMHLPLKIKYEI